MKVQIRCKDTEPGVSFMKYTYEQLEVLRSKLEDEKRHILQQVHQAYGQRTSFHGDLADRSVSLENTENNLGLEEVERERLLDIEKALQQIDEGTYGVCEMCNKQIAYERLEAVPATSYCTECKNKLEKDAKGE